MSLTAGPAAGGRTRAVPAAGPAGGGRPGQLAAEGVAVWLDDISRDRLASGSLAELVRTRHVTGVTSNPTIFAQAVSNGTAYDRQLAELAARGAAAEEAARQIVLGQPLAHVHRQQQRLITLRIKEVLRHTQDPKYRPYLTEGTPFMRQAETSIAALL